MAKQEGNDQRRMLARRESEEHRQQIISRNKRHLFPFASRHYF